MYRSLLTRGAFLIGGGPSRDLRGVVFHVLGGFLFALRPYLSLQNAAGHRGRKDARGKRGRRVEFERRQRRGM
jgi:hypothetical protein